VLLLAVSTGVAAEEHAWLIGGGNNPRHSEAQIEQNVIWAARTLQALPGRRRLHLYFTDGNDPGHDIKEILPARDDVLEPVSRLYEFGRRHRIILRNHRVPGVLGGTARDSLEPALRRDFRARRPGDQVLLVFNGHGTPARRGFEQHRLWLWGDTWLDVGDLERLLSEIPDGVTTRFVLTQCYSGGFARVVHPRAANTLALTSGERCGFMASAADQPAEGCSASVDVGRYRDYSTYFFAALSGRARDGGPLLRSPDLDGDGRVSPYEAHLYAMAAANSADVPRSTSEDFLERWQQGVFRWRGGGRAPVQADNVYGALTIELARRAGLDARRDNFEQQWLEQRIAESQRIRQSRRELKRLERSIRELQADISRDVEAKHPGLRAQVMQAGFTPGAAVREAIARIRRHPRYPALVAAQDSEDARELQLLDHERRLSRLERIDRLRRLSLWLHRFEATASDEDKNAYRRLLACEKKPLGGPGP
jgi:hypothetical protein